MNQIDHIYFTFEDKIIHHLMLNASSLKRNSLFYGKLGIDIAFFEHGRFWNQQVFTDFAAELRNHLPNVVDKSLNPGFAAGVCGFGWGLEYMVQQQFIDSEDIEVCTDIDQRVMAMDIRRMTDISIETGLEGVLHYILIRIKGAKDQNRAMPFDDLYLKDVYNKLQSLAGISNSLHVLKQAFVSYMDTGLLTYQPDICLFTKSMELKDEEDMISAKLGLADGLAGKIVRSIYQIDES